MELGFQDPDQGKDVHGLVSWLFEGADPGYLLQAASPGKFGIFEGFVCDFLIWVLLEEGHGRLYRLLAEVIQEDLALNPAGAAKSPTSMHGNHSVDPEKVDLVAAFRA